MTRILMLVLFISFKHVFTLENIKTELHELFDDYYKWLLEIHPQSASWVSDIEKIKHSNVPYLLRQKFNFLCKFFSNFLDFSQT